MCVTGVVSQEPRYCVSLYWSLNSDKFTSTLSHMSGSWYFPMFLFRYGSLTLTRMASLIDLAMFWSSLPIMLMSMDIAWPVVLWVRGLYVFLGIFLQIFCHACISIQGWVTDADENGLFDWSGNVLILPPHNANVVNEYSMTSGFMGEGAFMFFLNLSTSILPCSICSSSQSHCHAYICIS